MNLGREKDCMFYCLCISFTRELKANVFKPLNLKTALKSWLFSLPSYGFLFLPLFLNLFHYFNQFVLFCVEFIYIREQGAKIHDCVSWTLPEHGFPPWDGAGCVQDRVRDIIPAPHVTLQEPQLPQFDQPPLTARKVFLLAQNFEKDRILYKGCNIKKL